MGRRKKKEWRMKDRRNLPRSNRPVHEPIHMGNMGPRTEGDAELWNTFRWRAMGRFLAVNIRESAANNGEEMKRHFRTDKRDRELEREGELRRIVLYTEDTTDRLRNMGCKRNIDRSDGSKSGRRLRPDTAQDTSPNRTHSSARRR